ncbi:MAG: dephospho-CoA kinase [Candidatus Magnetominusculus sp. LBB02]|nr:dephospho-CoA kinase [Candidatus Magnetominusculus sp. LBB02]
MLAGLTGNIGSGKSSVLAMFKSLGARVISADGIVKRLLTEQETLSKIRAALGDGVFSEDGTLDKQKTAGLVFNNEALRKRLEKIIHPAVMSEIRDYALPDEITIAEVPLLFEGGFTSMVNYVITVTAPKEIVFERLGKKGQLSKEDIAKRLACQIPDEKKAADSDFVVINSGSIEDTERQVREIYRLLLHRDNV